MPNEFPVMLFKAPGPHDIHGGKYDYRIAQDEEDAVQALQDGWHLTTPEAKAAYEASKSGDKAPQPVAGQDPAPVEDSAPSRDELKQKADELGIEYAKNIPTEKLAELVDAALAKPQGTETAPGTETTPE